MFCCLWPSILLVQPVSCYFSLFTDNFRLGEVMDSLTQYVCPVAVKDCSSCLPSHPLLLCRVCCSSLASSPLTMQEVATESRNSMAFTEWLSASFWLAGLRMVFQNHDPPDQREGVARELVELIKNFHVFSGRDGAENQTERVGLESENLCGYYLNFNRESMLVGGTEVDQLGQHPWQLSLATGFLGMWYQHRCGAVVLARRWALTAAHCVDSLDWDLYVMGGFLDIDKGKEVAQIRLVDWFVYHENFNELYEQDIALLHLSEPLVFTPRLLPACLPTPHTSHEGETATLTGWGRQSHNGPLSTRLEMVDLPVISNVKCEELYKSTGSWQHIPESTFLCAGWEEGLKDACSGDSGGPLTVTRKDGRVEVIGVVSWGIGCGSAGRPGVYTRITEFLPWIEDVIREYEEEFEQKSDKDREEVETVR